MQQQQQLLGFSSNTPKTLSSEFTYYRDFKHFKIRDYYQCKYFEDLYSLDDLSELSDKIDSLKTKITTTDKIEEKMNSISMIIDSMIKFSETTFPIFYAFNIYNPIVMSINEIIMSGTQINSQLEKSIYAFIKAMEIHLGDFEIRFKNRLKILSPSNKKQKPRTNSCDSKNKKADDLLTKFFSNSTNEPRCKPHDGYSYHPSNPVLPTSGYSPLETKYFPQYPLPSSMPASPSEPIRTASKKGEYPLPCSIPASPPEPVHTASKKGEYPLPCSIPERSPEPVNIEYPETKYFPQTPDRRISLKELGSFKFEPVYTPVPELHNTEYFQGSDNVYLVLDENLYIYNKKTGKSTFYESKIVDELTDLTDFNISILTYETDFAKLDKDGIQDRRNYRFLQELSSSNFKEFTSIVLSYDVQKEVLIDFVADYLDFFSKKHLSRLLKRINM